MNLIDFWQENLQFKFNTILENSEIKLIRDDSEFVVVDGEEGDYGTLRYFDTDNQLIATRVIESGDEDNIEFTPHGKNIISMHLESLFKQLLISFKKDLV